MTHQAILAAAGLDGAVLGGGRLVVRTPIDGTELAHLETHTPDEVGRMIEHSVKAFAAWRSVPAPRRGELSVAW
jgi:aldehyde dehydrogenase (NAD+)